MIGTINQTEITKNIELLEEEVMKKKELAELRKKLPYLPLTDYAFRTVSGIEISLSEIFSGRSELILIQNMGKKCTYCTLWADRFNGVVHHLENRASFAVISPDSWEEMRDFAESRNWKFKIYSSHKNTFKKDTGFAGEKNEPWPGISILVKNKDGEIYQTSNAWFGPGDNYCNVWDIFDLLPDGACNWQPKFKYSESNQNN